MSKFVRRTCVLLTVLLSAGSFLSGTLIAQETPGPLEKRSTREWMQRLDEWRVTVRVASENADREADRMLVGTVVDQIRSVRDPAAIPVFEKLLIGRDDYRLQLASLESLRSIATGEAIRVLVRASVVAKGEAFRVRAAHEISQLADPAASHPYFIKHLSVPLLATPTAEALQRAKLISPPNSQQDGQARPLDKKLVYALINALVYVRTEKMPVPYYWDTGWLISSKIPGNLHRHREWGTRHIPIENYFVNQSVLDTLRKYSGQDFGFQQEAWRNWARQISNRQSSETQSQF